MGDVSSMRSSEGESRQLALLWGAAALACVLLSPLTSYIVAALPHCPFKQLTGIPCPACGSGRAALALARFDMSGALLRYPMPSLAWIAFVIMGLWAGVRGCMGKGIPAIPRRIPNWLVAVASVVFLFLWSYSFYRGN